MLAEFFGDGSDCDLEASVTADGKDAGQGHHAGPAGCAVFGFGARLLDPAPEDAVALLIELGFGGVEAAVVEQTGLLLVEEEIRGGEGTGLPEDFALRGVDEDVLGLTGRTWEREEVGALPHVSRIDGIGGAAAGG